jgi:hypothetical protein
MSCSRPLSLALILHPLANQDVVTRIPSSALLVHCANQLADVAPRRHPRPTDWPRRRLKRCSSAPGHIRTGAGDAAADGRADAQGRRAIRGRSGLRDPTLACPWLNMEGSRVLSGGGRQHGGGSRGCHLPRGRRMRNRGSLRAAAPRIRRRHHRCRRRSAGRHHAIGRRPGSGTSGRAGEMMRPCPGCQVDSFC